MKLSEKHVQKQIMDFLAWDGWTVRHWEFNFSEKKGKSVGEVGMPDLIAVRYHEAPRADIMYIEVKAPGKSPRLDQIVWHRVERERGAMVLVVDDIDRFREWYGSSGLQRR